MPPFGSTPPMPKKPHSSTQIKQILIPAVSDRGIDDLRQSADSPNLCPPGFTICRLPPVLDRIVVEEIGAKKRYSECSNAAGS